MKIYTSIKYKVFGLLVAIALLSSSKGNAQTICMDTALTLLTAGWSGAPSNPAYSPPASCINNNGQTGNLSNGGFSTEYDNPTGYLWTRTLSGLSASNSYKVVIQLQSTGNSLDLRNAYFQNYNLGRTNRHFYSTRWRPRYYHQLQSYSF